MARRKKSRSSRALSQAKLTAKLRYLPEAEALAGLLRDEDVNYRVGVRTEKGIAAGITQGLREATPLVAQNYTRALESSRDNAHYASSKLSPLGASADDIKAAAFAEQAGAHRRISESGAGTLKEYAGRLADTKAGEAFAVRNLGNVRAGNIGKIRAKQGSLARQRGMFTQAQYETFLDKLDDAALDSAKFRETKRHNRTGEGIAQQNANTTERNSRKKDGGKGGKPKAESQASKNYKATLSDARGAIRDLKGQKKKPHEVRQALLGSKAGQSRGGRTIVNAAMDFEYRGYLSRPNYMALRRDLGVRVPKSWLRKPKARPRRRGSAIPGVNLVR